MLERVVVFTCGGIDFRYVCSFRIWRTWCRRRWPYVNRSKCISTCRTFAIVLGVPQWGNSVPGTEHALEAMLMVRFGWLRRLWTFKRDVLGGQYETWIRRGRRLEILFCSIRRVPVWLLVLLMLKVCQSVFPSCAFSAVLL